MTTHARETKQLWDAFNPDLQIKPDNNKVLTPMECNELPDICYCGGIIGPDGLCDECYN